MFTTDDFLQYTQWSGIITLVLASLTILGFVFRWGLRFRLVGTSGFMLLLTVGLFALSIVPIKRTVVPGAARYTLIYDNGANQAVIATSNQISPTQLAATLRQAASNLYSYGRLGSNDNNQMIVRARTIIHPQPGISQPIYLGQLTRRLTEREDVKMEVKIYADKFAQLAKPSYS